MLKIKNIFILFLVNFFVFFIVAFVAKISCIIVLNNPVNTDYSVQIGREIYSVNIFNDDSLEIKIPYYASGFKIKNIDNTQIKSLFVSGKEIKSFDQIGQELLRVKIVMLLKVFALSLAALFIEVILMSIFYIPNKDKFWIDLKSNKTVFYISLTILGLFILWNFYNICQTAVDVPYWDEWEALNPGHLDSKLNLDWIFSFHNEHKIIWTRLFTWIMYHIDGWNLKHQIILNFFLYLALLFMLYKIIPDKNSLLPLFFIPCFSDVLIENQLTGFQSAIYFMLLFSFIAIYFGFVKETNLQNSVLFGVFSVCAMFSMTFISGLALFLAYLFKHKKLDANLMAAGSIVFLGLVGFFVNYNALSVQGNLVLPNKIVFWNSYFKIIISGLFNMSFPIFWTLISGILIFGALGWLFVSEKNKKDIYVYFALFILSFCLCAGIAAGRIEGNSLLVVASRYLNIVNFLIPCIGALFVRMFNAKLALIYLVILCISFSSCYTFANYYANMEYRIQAKQEMFVIIKSDLEKYMIGKLNPFDLKDSILRAKELNVSFLREFENE